MKRTIKLTESDLHNIIKETVINIIGESFGDARNERTNDYASGFSIFDSEIGEKIKNNNFNECFNYTRKIKNLVNEILNPTRLDIPTIVEFLPIFFENLKSSIKNINVDIEYLVKVKREIDIINNLFQQKNIEELKKHAEYLLFYVDIVEDEIKNLIKS